MLTDRDKLSAAPLLGLRQTMFGLPKFDNLSAELDDPISSGRKFPVPPPPTPPLPCSHSI